MSLSPLGRRVIRPLALDERAPLIESLEPRELLSGTVAIWTGSAGDGLWGTAGNWQANAVPTAGQDVEFDNHTGTGTPQIVQVGTAREIGNLVADNTILQGTAPITIDGDITVGTSNYVAFFTPVILAHTTTINVSNGTGSTFSDLLFTQTVSDGGHGYGLNIVGSDGGGEVDLVACNIQDGNANYINAQVTDTYTGNTTVSGGALLTIEGNLASTVSASDNAQVNGIGSWNGITASGSGTEIIADDPYAFDTGVIKASGGLTLGAGVQYFAQISGNTLGNETEQTGYSQVDVTGGTISLAGATLQTVPTSKSMAYTPAPGDVFTIIKNDTGKPTVGTFANLPEGGHLTVSGVPLTISYHGGASGNDVTLSDPTIPIISSATATLASNGKTATLKAVASDTQSLTYTWTVAKKPAGAKTPTFSINGSHNARRSVVSFFKHGTYDLRVTVSNAQGGRSSRLVKIIVK